MEWIVFLILAAAIFAASAVWASVMTRSKYKSGRFLTPSKILFVGVVLTAIVLFIPIYANTFKQNECGIFETVVIAVHNMIRLFVVDGEFSFITDNIGDVAPWVFKGYTILFSVLFVLAPTLTFGFVLSFFKNVSAYRMYLSHFNSDIYIFSELNEKSLALATSIYNTDPKQRFIVFTDVFEREEEENYELVEKAKELGAVCFKKDIVTVDFSAHSKKTNISFFTIGENHSENIGQALKLVEKFKDRENTHLYVFSTQVEAEILLANAFNGENGEAKIKVRRVNEVRSLISRNLYENGYEKIFESAYEADGVKEINAVVIGMGQHGTEMTKALAWFCQMDGYKVQINSFDTNEKAEEKFTSLCPELMSPEFNGRFDIEGEAAYKITVHSGVDVDTKNFDNIIDTLPKTTYVFVAMGNDEKNISISLKLRTLFLRKGIKPVIQTVVYNTEKKEALTNIVNFKNEAYEIDFIGDMRSSYSDKVILGSDVEAVALDRHKKWGKEKEFWQFDYNYKSSVASAIHRKMKELCGIPGIDKMPEEREESELWNLRILEHKRWNAYMRSEGYVYSGSDDPASRNDLAKMHHCLVPFERLSDKDKKKDDD